MASGPASHVTSEALTHSILTEHFEVIDFSLALLLGLGVLKPNNDIFVVDFSPTLI